MALFSFVVVIVVCYGLSYLLMHNLAHVSRGKYTLLRLFLLPGIIVHELSHALACVVTGTPIERISFWTEAGGEVVHHKPKLHIITQPFIAFAPLPVGISLLLLASHYLSLDQWLLSLILLLFMVSIAATLAPSKTDAVNGLEGLIIMLLIAGTIFYVYPASLESASRYVAPLTNQLLIVAGILAGMWVITLLLGKSLRRF